MHFRAFYYFTLVKGIWFFPRGKLPVNIPLKPVVWHVDIKMNSIGIYKAS